MAGTGIGGISTFTANLMRKAKVLDTNMAYVDVGPGSPEDPSGVPQQTVLFLHGNPTSSFLWRHIIPEVKKAGAYRCLAPDLIGMGNSDKMPKGFQYTFEEHAKYLYAWIERMNLGPVTLVVHDWGSGLGFNFARLHPEKVKGLCYMESVLPMQTWEDFGSAAKVFQGFRSPAGEDMVISKNVFVERVLPGSIMRKLADEEMEVYRRPFKTSGEDRRPTLTFPREIPVAGGPKNMWDLAEAWTQNLEKSQMPKLLIVGDPGAILVGPQLERARKFPNQKEMKVKGIHFVQEDSAIEIGTAVGQFVGKLPGGASKM